mmetsp:Transcript_1525/g.3284  ORF Transcript_1525/g.3284 Transcript_1525/m.3284 type:complete len:213 (-) Transcript_1525:450-1088(-)
MRKTTTPTRTYLPEPSSQQAWRKWPRKCPASFAGSRGSQAARRGKTWVRLTNSRRRACWRPSTTWRSRSRPPCMRSRCSASRTSTRPLPSGRLLPSPPSRTLRRRPLRLQLSQRLHPRGSWSRAILAEGWSQAPPPTTASAAGPAVPTYSTRTSRRHRSTRPPSRSKPPGRTRRVSSPLTTSARLRAQRGRAAPLSCPSPRWAPSLAPSSPG